MSTLYVALLCCVLQEPAATTNNRTLEDLQNRARAEYWSGLFAQSEATFLAALRMVPPRNQIQRAEILAKLGDVFVNEDQLQNAEQVYLESLTIYKKAADKNKTILLLRNLGAVYSLQRRDDEAVGVLKEALKIGRSGPQADATLIGPVLNSLGVAYFRQRDITRAEKFFLEAAQLLPVSGLFRRVDLLNNLGAVYHAKRQFEKAENYLSEALKLTEAEVGPMHPDLTFSLSILGMIHTDMGKYAEAEAHYQRALDILDPAGLVFETRIARLLQALSGTYAKAGRKAEAHAALARAAAIARRKATEHPDMAFIIDAYAESLKKNGKAKEARELQVEARRAKVASGLVINAHRP